MILSRLKTAEDQITMLTAADEERSREYEALLSYLRSQKPDSPVPEQMFPMESTQLYKEMVRKNENQRYDPEQLDSYSLDWSSIQTPPNSYYRPLSQLTQLCKRTPSDR